MQFAVVGGVVMFKNAPPFYSSPSTCGGYRSLSLTRPLYLSTLPLLVVVLLIVVVVVVVVGSLIKCRCNSIGAAVSSSLPPN